MRKTILTLLAFMLIFVGLLTPVTMQAREILVTIDGMAVDFQGQPPTIVDGRTLVPVRGVFEALGFEVDFDNNTRTAILVGSQGSPYSNYEFRVPIGSSYFELNGQSFQLDVPAQIINGRTMLPIRHLLEQIGFSVDWHNEIRQVIIQSPSPIARMSHEEIFDSLIGTWIVQESDMPGGHHFSSFTFDAYTDDIHMLRGHGEVVIGAERQRIFWMLNAYRDFLFSFLDDPEKPLMYNPIIDLNADSVTLFHNAAAEDVDVLTPHTAVYVRVQ